MPARLRFSIPAVRHGAVRRSITIWLAQALAVCVIIGVWIANPFVSTFPFGFFGVLIAVVLLFVSFGRVTTSVGPYEITVRWHVGPLGKRRSVPVAAVEGVLVGEDGIRHTALVTTTDQMLSLTFFHRRRTDHAVAGLVLWQLERLGYRSADD